MSENVVDFAGDLLPGCASRLRLCAFPQRHEEPAAVVHEQSPAGGGALTGRADEEQQQAGSAGFGTQQRIGDGSEQAERKNRQRSARRPVHGDREQPDQHRPGHHLREARQQHERHRYLGGPAAAEPQRPAAQCADRLIQGEQPCGDDARDLGCADPQPGQYDAPDDGQGEQCEVHEPVAEAAGTLGCSHLEKSLRSLRRGLPVRGPRPYRSHRSRYFRRCPRGHTATSVNPTCALDRSA